MLRIKQGPTVLFLCFCWVIIGLVISAEELYQENRIGDFESFVDQATPRFELGKKDLQSPALPLGHIAKRIQNRWKFSPFGLDYWTFFIVLTFWILFSLIPFLKEILPFFDWIWSTPSIDSISKHTMPKNFSSLFYWKRKCGFSVTKAKIHDKFEPLTIDCWLWIHERFLDLNLNLGFPNDIRKYKLIHN